MNIKPVLLSMLFGMYAAESSASFTKPNPDQGLYGRARPNLEKSLSDNDAARLELLCREDFIFDNLPYCVGVMDKKDTTGDYYVFFVARNNAALRDASERNFKIMLFYDDGIKNVRWYNKKSKNGLSLAFFTSPKKMSPESLFVTVYSQDDSFMYTVKFDINNVNVRLLLDQKLPIDKK